MFVIKYNCSTHFFQINFSGESFDDYIGIVAHSILTYNPNTKEWKTKNATYVCDVLLPKLKSIGEEGIYNVEEITKLKKLELKNVDSTIFFRNKLLPQIYKLPPLVGKSPNEEFQQFCIQKGITQNRLALFLEMGLGKTYITICILNQLFLQNKINKVLIICPGSALFNWRRELKQFSTFATDDNFISISTVSTNRVPFEDLEKKVYLMTYRHFLTLSDQFYKEKHKKKSTKYKSACIPWDIWGDTRAIVLDESHGIKNFQSRQSKVLHIHKKYFYYRYILTGTPAPNGFDELYSQIKFLDEVVIPEQSYLEWGAKIATVGNRFNMYALNRDQMKPEVVVEEEKRISPLVLRYKSKDVLNLPELYVKPIYVEMTSIQKSIYQEIVNYVFFVVKKENSGVLTPREVRNKFPFIVQAYENACLLQGKIDEGFSSTLFKNVNKFKFDNKHHAKLDIVDSLLSKYINTLGKKVAIMDYHPKTLDQLAERYKKYNPICIHGGNTPKGVLKEEFRDTEIERFKKDEATKLLIGSSQVLNVALNITECDTVIYFARDFSFLNWSQSIKRFHRNGSLGPVTIMPIISENTLEEGVELALQKKRNLDESIFKKNSLTKEQWLKVFTGAQF